MRRRAHLPNDRGAALLTVLMLVALMSAIIAVAFDRTGAALNRTRSRIATHEARFDLMAAERIALTRLGNVLGQPEADRTNPRIIRSAFTVPVPSGKILARISDGGSCFNLNALVITAPTGDFIAQPAMIDQFARVLQLSGLPQDRALTIAAMAADWIDSDSLPLAPGSEGSSRTRVANRPMMDARELRGAAGLDAATFARISPLVCALPEYKPPNYNVNAVPPERAALVAALLDRTVPLDAVASALKSQPEGGYGYAQDLLAHPALKPYVGRGEANIQLVTRTIWFRLDLDAQLGDSGMAETALIDARTRPVRLVYRSYGEP